MRIHKGTHRIVIVIGCLAFRIAGMRLGKFFWRLIRYDFWNRGGYISVRIRWRRTRFWLWYDLTNGIGENFREVIFYWSTRHHLVVPTYFSVGVMNVAPAVTVVPSPRLCPVTLAHKIRAHGDQEFLHAWASCAHTFEDPDNFYIHDGRVQLLDYGEEGIQLLLLRYGGILERLLVESLKPQ
ncbi:MAG: hypothetical protein Q7S16_03690 [bacterium]|nr:hypothetical protein [bacterium]